MRYLFLALLLVAAVLLLFQQSGNCVDFYLLGYSGRGELIPARICSVPQEGVFVEDTVVGSKLAESARVAYEVFKRRHGPIASGILFSVEGPVYYVDGRSADLAIYAAIYALFNGGTPVLATGRIAEDLYTVDGVAYVREKLSAVGQGPVIIPYANRRDIPDEAPVIAVKNLDEVDAVLSSLPS
ncbi:MAG: hypothetical protein GXO00_01780 [Candidatus Diapherotrites archaeon]|nr:hypothetical protein [Candidatus Diapherotrites archaeon]